MEQHFGRCLCGHVVYALSSRPFRSTVCYCNFCQRATGSSHMILTVVKDSAFSMQKGAPAQHAHRSEGSGKEIYINFCTDCGTKLYVTLERWPGVVGLYSGTLDHPDIAPLTPDTAKQVFAGSARAGTVLMPDLPTYWAHAIENDGTECIPVVLPHPMPVEEVTFPDSGKA